MSFNLYVLFIMTMFMVVQKIWFITLNIHNVKIVYKINKIIENLDRDLELHQILSNVLISFVNAFFPAWIRIASTCSSTRT